MLHKSPSFLSERHRVQYSSKLIETAQTFKINIKFSIIDSSLKEIDSQILWHEYCLKLLFTLNFAYGPHLHSINIDFQARF
jgi:hypothetical protein